MKNRVSNLFYLFVAVFLLLLAGCSNISDSGSANNDSEATLWSNSENGFTEKIKLKKTVEDGVTTTALSYLMAEDSSGKGVGFGVLKIESSNTEIYKGVIITKRETEEFPNNFWTHYKINCGQSTVSMTNAISGPVVEDGFFEFMIIGELSASKINDLKNANVIQVTLSNSDYPERNTTFVCDSNFVLNLIKYF